MQGHKNRNTDTDLEIFKPWSFFFMFQIMITNATQGKSRAFQSLTPYIRIHHKTQKFGTAFNISCWGSGCCPHRPRLWSQVYRCDYSLNYPNRSTLTLPWDILMLRKMSSSYPCQHQHHRNPFIKPFKSPWLSWMICIWTSTKSLILFFYIASYKLIFCWLKVMKI